MVKFYVLHRLASFHLDNRYFLLLTKILIFIMSIFVMLNVAKASDVKTSDNAKAIAGFEPASQQATPATPNLLFKILQIDEKNHELNAVILDYNFPFLETIDPAQQNLGTGNCGFLYGRYLSYWVIDIVEETRNSPQKSKELGDILQSLMLLNGFLMLPFHCEQPMGFHDADNLDYYLKTSNAMQGKKWLETAAWQGQKSAQLALANFYSKSANDEEKKQAFKWWLMLANAGDKNAIYRLGQLYEDGIIVDKDLKRAFYYYEKAANLGNTNAVAKLGAFYASGGVVQKDLKKAFDYYWDAAKEHDAESQFYLFKAYWNGAGVEKDQKAAIQWALKAASMDHRGSQCLLGEEYFKGTIFQKDLMEAYRLCYMVTLRSDPPHEKAEAMMKRIAQTVSDSDIKAARKQVRDCLSGELKACPRYLLPDDPAFGFSFAFETYSNKVAGPNDP